MSSDSFISCESSKVVMVGMDSKTSNLVHQVEMQDSNKGSVPIPRDVNPDHRSTPCSVC